MLPNDNDDNATPDPASSHSLATVLGPALLLPKIALQQVFALPGDALPRGITRLTGLTQDDVRRFVAFSTTEQYEQALHHEAALFYYYALTGWLAYQSVLGEAIRERLHGAGTPATAETVARAELIAEGIVGLLQRCVPTSTRETTEALEELFAQEKYGLVPCLSALVPPADPAGLPAEVPETWLSMKFEPQELHLFSLAIFLTHTATFGVSHPLGRAINGVAALAPETELIALAQRFKAAQAEAAPELALTGPDVIRLYLSLQVLALLFVAELQPELMQRLDPEQNQDGPWTDPDQQQNMVTYVCTQVEAFGMLFDNLFGEEPTYQAAKATARELAALV